MEWGHNCLGGKSSPKRLPGKVFRRELSLPLHHGIWLSAHPERDYAWFRKRIEDGFVIHHHDGNSENDAPGNLVMIEGKDHMMIHGRLTVLGAPSHRPAELNSSARTKRWREENRDRYNAYMRDYQAKRRQAAAEVKEAQE